MTSSVRPRNEDRAPPSPEDGHFPVGPVLAALDAGHYGLGRASLLEVLRSPAPEEFFERVDACRRELPEENPLDRIVVADPAVRRRIGQMPVAILTDEAHRVLTTIDSTIEPPRLVWMSPETALKQLKHGRSDLRRPLRPEHYRLIPEVVETGRLLIADERRLPFFCLIDRLHEAVVKRTRNNELFLTTFHLARPRDLRAAIRRDRSPAR